MYIEHVPNRNSPPAILLRESYRDGNKVKKRTLANLSSLPAEVIEGLKVLLRGGVAYFWRFVRAAILAGACARQRERSIPVMTQPVSARRPADRLSIRRATEKAKE